MLLSFEVANKEIVTRFPDTDQIDLRLGSATRKLQHRSASPLARKCAREIFCVFRKQWVD